MAKLNELLTENEKQKVHSMKLYGFIDPFTDIRNMTVAELSTISFILIETDYDGKCDGGVLSAVAITILTQRAIERNIAIF